MTERRVLIVGGGLAGLSAGCYARASGFRTTIVEHNLALGGVCTAWERGPYTIDGCIHWLTGGAFSRVYEELGIVPRVGLRPLEQFAVYRDAGDGFQITVGRDLEAFAATLREVAPEDAAEIGRLVDGVAHLLRLVPPIDRPVELSTMRDQLRSFWSMRHELGTIVHFHKPIDVYVREHLQNARLRRLFTHLVPDEAPAILLLMILGYLQQGYLSRPEGGTAAFRDALVDTYHRLGGQSVLLSTVDEILVEAGRAAGLRLGDGTILEGDVVISTASAPETVLRLLGGRYGADDVRERLETWRLFQPIVLASYGVALPLADVPPTLLLDHVDPITVGGLASDHLYVRTYHSGPGFAPPGHSVVQMMLPTDYGWWATRGSHYTEEKDEIASLALERLDAHLPGVRAAVKITDVATPLTYWNLARSWRGAYEGWMPSTRSFFGHVRKTLPGLECFYMAGQWVEPGGGVPTALMSGRQVAQLLCEAEGRPFELPCPVPHIQRAAE